MKTRMTREEAVEAHIQARSRLMQVVQVDW
jgi:hypothetical protein